MIDFGRYKTYDDSNGRGSSFEWASKLKEYLDLLREQINEEVLDIPQDLLDKYPPIDPNKYRGYKREGLEYCKTTDELNKEFRRLLMKVHPDIAGDTKENTEKTQKLIEQYEKLKKKLNRKKK